MLNRIESYIEAGTKSARARHQGDENTARHWADHARRMWRLESPADRARAESEYRNAYRAESYRMRPPLPFA